MSILKNLSTNKCPYCGCTIVKSESIEIDRHTDNYRQHCNGRRWENREFACGYSARHVPNFKDDIEGTYSECTKNEEYIKEQKAKEKVAEDFKDFCKQKGISDSDYDRMSYYIKN